VERDRKDSPGGRLWGDLTTFSQLIEPPDGGPSACGPGRPRGAHTALSRQVDRGIRWGLKHTGDILPASVVLYDSLLIRRRMRRALGYWPDLRHPTTYNEKLAWRILHDRNPLIALTTDKVAVRDYVSAKVGSEILVPIIGVYDRETAIPWEELPSSFVLKASHGSDMNLVVWDKDKVQKQDVLMKARSWLERNYYDTSREWAYRMIRPQLLIEELLVTEDGRACPDLKFLVFHGRAVVVAIHLDRFGEHRANFYDPELRLLPVRGHYPLAPSFRPAPEMRPLFGLAERLAEDFDYVRVDLYLLNGKVRFGELTHYDASAQQRFIPEDFDRWLGAQWRIPAV
jgi:hypothetical protein